jgi:uncharacterized protein
MLKTQFSKIVVYIILAYALAWAIWLVGINVLSPMTAMSDERFFPFLLAGSFAPTIAALVVTGLSGDMSAMRSLLTSLIRVRVNWRIYLFTFFLLPLVGLLAYLILGIPGKIELWQFALSAIVLAPVNAFFGGIVFGAGPLGEEMGWRGIMQEHLQSTFNRFVLALIIGLIWTFWHLPLFAFEDWRNGLDLPLFAILYPVSLILIAFTMGHLWRWSKGSLFITIFFHAIVNITATALTNSEWWNLSGYSATQIYVTILVLFAIIAILAEIFSRTIFRSLMAAPSAT